MRIVGLIVVACVVAGCAPGDPAKQAEAIGSIAAEGALLAHDAAEGSSTEIFVREHAEALGGKLDDIRSVIDDRRLAAIATSVSAGLVRLSENPGDEHEARGIERDLERAASEAEELAQ
jgi:hypothetical protein